MPRVFSFLAGDGLSLSGEGQRQIEQRVVRAGGELPIPADLWKLFREVLLQPHAGAALRAMRQTGLLAAHFPELKAIDEVKELLNDLPKEELLAFIYFLYPDMITESEELQDLLPKREELAVRLFQKGKVGLERGARIAGVDVPKFSSLVGKRGIARYAD